MSDPQSHTPQHRPCGRPWAKGQSGNPAGQPGAVAIELPPIRTGADIAPAVTAIVAALAEGLITTGQAAELSQMLDTFVRAVDAREFERRLTQLENRLAPGSLR
jgi:hypothetical protein